MENLETKQRQSDKLIYFLMLFFLSINTFSQNVTSFTGTLKDMDFEAKISIKPDCFGDIPYIRATLHSINVTGFTYKGKYYNKYSLDIFPINIDEANLDIETYLEVGYDMYNRVELKKGYLSTQIGGSGSRYMVDEFRVSEKGVKELKQILQTTGCANFKKDKRYLNARLGGAIGEGINVVGGNFRYTPKGKGKYGDVALEDYLSNLIDKNHLKKQFEKNIKEVRAYETEGLTLKKYDEALDLLAKIIHPSLTESQKKIANNLKNKIVSYRDAVEAESTKMFNELNKYRSNCSSNKNSVDFYKKGISKTEELINYSKVSKENKRTLKIILKNIKNCLAQRIKLSIFKDKLKADLKRNDEKYKKGKVRLSKQELARINQQIAYNNKVKTITSRGISLPTAQKMANDEFKIDIVNNVVGTGLKQISNLIMDGIIKASERREAKYEANIQNISNYKKWFSNYRSKISKVNNERNQAIKKLPIYNYNSDNVADLKQEILGLLSFKDGERYSIGYNVSRNHTFSITKTKSMTTPYDVLNSSIIVERNIVDAYFENDQLIVKVKDVCKQASFDKNHLDTGMGKAGYQPAKFTLNTILKHNLNTGEEELFQNISWNGFKGIPGNNSFLPHNDLLKRNNKLNDLQVVVPKKYVLDETKILKGKIGLKLETIKKVKKDEEFNTKQSDSKFIEGFERSVVEDLKKHFNTLFNGNTPNLITTKSIFTPNPNETAFIVFFGGNGYNLRYLILSYPGEKYLNNLNPNNIAPYNLLTYKNEIRYQSKVNSKNVVFFQSKFNQEYAIGGVSGIDLLLSGSHKNVFDKNIYFFNNKNTLINETAFLNSNPNSEIWNPVIEVGDVEILVEKKYLTNKKLFEKYNRYLKWIKDFPKEEYRSNPNGIILKLHPVKTSTLALTKRSTYKYVGKINTKAIPGNNKTQGELLYYTPTSTSNFLAQKFITKDPYTIPLNKIIKYAPLDHVDKLMNYSDQFLNNYYKKFKDYKNNSIKGSPFGKGSQGRFYKMLKYFDGIDLSKQGIKFKGRKPTYYNNGKLKSLGLTKNGHKVGEWEYYNQQEELIKKVSYRNDYNKGFIKSWIEEYKNNTPISYKSYGYQGMLDEERFYKPSASILRVSLYSEEVIYLEKIYKAEDLFDEEGKLLETRDYENGILIKTTKE